MHYKGTEQRRAAFKKANRLAKDMVTRRDTELQRFMSRGAAATATHRAGGARNGMSVFGSYANHRKRTAAIANLSSQTPNASRRVTVVGGDADQEVNLQIVAAAEQVKLSEETKEFARRRHEELEAERRTRDELVEWSEISLSAQPPHPNASSTSAVLGSTREGVRQVPTIGIDAIELQSFELNAPAHAISTKMIALLDKKAALVAPLMGFFEKAHSIVDHNSEPLLKKLPPGVPGVAVYKKCLVAGKCVCGAVNGTELRGEIGDAFSSVLRTLFVKGSRGRRVYDQNLAVCRMTCDSGDEEHWVHVGMGNLNSGFYTAQPLAIAMYIIVAGYRILLRSGEPITMYDIALSLADVWHLELHRIAIDAPSAKKARRFSSSCSGATDGSGHSGSALATARAEETLASAWGQAASQTEAACADR